nr:hypothetical protein [Salsuginibacillus halophilus]
MLLTIGMIGTSAGFVLFILGLLHFMPVWIGSLLMFVSIFATLYFWNERKRFKGFHLKQ